MIIICPQCGALRSYKPSLAIKLTGFCKKCSRTGARSSQWEGGLVTLNCSCGSSKQVRRSRAKFLTRNGQLYTCFSCSLKTRKGKLNPNWKGGRIIYSYPREWGKRSRVIRCRDGHKCLLCGSTERPCRPNGTLMSLPVHHLDYDKHNLDQFNLVTLCYPCDGKTNTNRGFWHKKLLELLEEAYR